MRLRLLYHCLLAPFSNVRVYRVESEGLADLLCDLQDCSVGSSCSADDFDCREYCFHH